MKKHNSTQHRKEWTKKYREQNKERISEIVKKHQRNNPLQLKVQNFTKYYFERENECEICGTKENLEFHHWRYRLPLQKRDFNTLCKECHEIQHIKNPMEVLA